MMAKINRPMLRLGRTLFAIVVTASLAARVADADSVAAAGIAYDTVLKPVPAPDRPLQSQDFGADFQAGMSPTATCVPELVRRYVTPDRERIDDVCKQDATIVDCASRTVTVLDLQHKQYSRISLDAAYDDGIAEIRADSEKVGQTWTLAIENSAHGTRVIDGVESEEYANVRTQTVAGGNLSITTRDSWIYDFSPDPLPVLSCIQTAAAWLSRYGSPQRYAPELQSFFADRDRKVAGPRDHITESGPQLPDWRIPLEAAGVHFQRQSNVPDWTQHFAIESGNVRAIRSDNPVFSVPADFTTMAR